MEIKKIISGILAASVASSMIISVAHAEVSVSLSGGDVTGKPVVLNCSDTYDSVEWQISTAQDGDYTAITLNSYVDTDAAYYIKPADKTKYLRAKVTVEGTDYYTDTVGPLPASKGPKSNESGNTWDVVPQYPVADYIFIPQDDTTKSFSLVDTADGLFVVANNSYGRVKHDSTNMTEMYKNVEGNIAYAFNTLAETGSWTASIIGNTKTFTLPTSIKENLKEHEWFTEAGNSDGGAPADYAFNAKITSLSYLEWIKYREKIGWDFSGTQYDDWWFLRTGSGSGAKTMHIVTNSYAVTDANEASCGRVINGGINTLKEIRPCFYLNDDYFLKNKIDPVNSGSVVKSYITTNYTAAELQENAGYTLSELVNLGFDMGLAEVSDVSINEVTETGRPVTVTYTKGNDCVDVNVKWYISDAADGVFSEITLMDGLDAEEAYMIKASDKNKYIKCTVFPINSDGIEGAGVSSNVIGPLPASKGPKGNDAPGEWTSKRAEPDSAYMFKPADAENNISGKAQTFILLDTAKANTDGLFILANDSFGGAMFDTDSTTQKFDAEGETNIGYKLKALAEGSWITEWWGNTRTIKFPASFVNNLKEHEWFIEAGKADGDTPADRYVTTKLALLSNAEWKDHREKIGYAFSPYRNNNWYLRTPSNIGGNYVSVVSQINNNANYLGQVINAPVAQYNDIRPCFYLDGDYFLNNKIDTDSVGEKVGEFITSRYTAEQLETSLGYTLAELVAIGYEFDNMLTVSDVKITEGATRFEPVTVSYTWDNSNSEEFGTTYRWYTSDKADGTFTEVVLSENYDVNKFTIRPADGGKYLKCIVYPADIDANPALPAESNVIGPLPESLGPCTIQSAMFENQPANTPAENVFKVSGSDREFILLDTSGSGNSKFFVFAKDAYGFKNYVANNTGEENFEQFVKYDPTNKNSVAYFMNNEFLTEGNGGKKIPDEIIAHMDAQHEWVTEAGNKNSDIPTDYVVKCAVAFLSYNEWITYHDKIGYDDGQQYGWFLRTARGDINDVPNAIMFVSTDKQAEAHNAPNNAGRAMQTSAGASMNLRPVFWLDEIFFTSEKLDVESMGANVKNYILENCTQEQMKAVGYTDAELIAIGYGMDTTIVDVTDLSGNAITAENVASITGVKYTLFAKEALNAQAVAAFYDADGALVGIKTATIEEYTKGNNVKTIEFESAFENAASMKLMLWNSVGGMKPICDAYGLPAQTLKYDEYFGEPICYETPSEYVFELENGEEYILLDNNENSFFVMSKDSVANLAFDEDATQKFDIEDSNNIGFYLNNDYFDSLILNDYIENNHEWITEGGTDNGNCTEKYSYNAAVSLLSYTEWITYKSRIGSKDNLENNWWLRTSRGVNAEPSHGFVVNIGGGGAIIAQNTDEPADIRPVFYLSKDFLKNFKINAETCGSAVKDIICKTFTSGELCQSGYTEGELSVLGYTDLEPVIVTAELSGGDVTGYPLTLSYQTSGICTDIGINWQYCIMKNGNYVDLTRNELVDINDNEYYIKPEDAKRYIKCIVTPVGEDGEKGEAVTTNIIGPLPYSKGPIGGDLDGLLDGAIAETPAENTFSTDGQTFIFLEADESGDIIALSKDCCGTKGYTTTSGNVRFDPENTNNIAYYLNNDFLAGGNKGYTLPQGIIDNLNFNHSWFCEGGHASSDAPADYNVTCAVALLSYSEWTEHYKKIGYDDGMTAGWSLRTPRGDKSDLKDTILLVRSIKNFPENEQGRALGYSATASVGMRPVVALKRDFFKNVHAEEIGANVAEFIVSNYTATELKDGAANYQNHELREMGFEIDGIDEIASVSFDGAPFFVQNQGEVGFDLRLDITGEEEQSYNVVYSIDKEEYTDVITVVPGVTFEKRYTFENQPCGIFEANVKIQSSDDIILEKNQQIAVMREYTYQFMEDSSRGVMATHMLMSAGNTDRSELDLMKQIGVRKVRDELNWSMIEPAKGEYSFVRADVPMSWLDEVDIEPRIILSYNNFNYVTDTDGISDPSKVAPRTYEELQGFAEYAKQLVLRYPEIDTVEVWNEANWSYFWKPEVNMFDYATMVKAVTVAINEVRSEVRVIGGSLVHSDFGEAASTLLDEGAMDYADAISTHPYYFPQSVNTVMRKIFNVSNEMFDRYGVVKGRYGTETGLPTSNNSYGISEEGQADALSKTFIYSDAAGIKETTWYNFRNKGINPADNEHNFGIINYDFSPKPALVALNQTNRVLNGSHYIGKIEIADNITAYVYMKNSKPVCAVWSTGSQSFEWTVNHLSVEDIYGNVLDKSKAVVIDSNIKYIYGLDDEILIQAVKNTYTEKSDLILAELSELGFENTISAWSGSVTLSEVESELDKLDNIAKAVIGMYKTGEITDTQMMRILSYLIKMSDVISVLNGYKNGAITEYERTAVEFDKVNSYALSVVLDDYEELLEIAEKETESSEKTQTIAAITKASGMIAGWIEALSAFEEADEGYGIIIYTDEGNYKADGNMEITVQNESKKSIDGAYLKLYNSSNELISETEISAEVGSINVSSLEFTLPETAGKHKWNIAIEKDGKVISRRGVYVTVE